MNFVALESKKTVLISSLQLVLIKSQGNKGGVLNITEFFFFLQTKKTA